MSFDLTDEWVWDFWVVDDPDSPEPTYHLFFLKAPRTLGEPERRHVNASIGHAVSADLHAWTRVADALGPQPAGAFDDLANWTGCVVRDDDARWHLFTTGVSHAEEGAVQRIGASTSADLHHWTPGRDLLLGADHRWYRRRPGSGPDEHWRDPWVVRDDNGGWHMYVTAQAPGDSGHEVIGHATSADLRSWEIGPPLSHPTGHVGKLVTMRDGASRFLAFENRGEEGQFVGGVIDPSGVRWNRQGNGLELLDGPKRWRP